MLESSSVFKSASFWVNGGRSRVENDLFSSWRQRIRNALVEMRYICVIP